MVRSEVRGGTASHPTMLQPRHDIHSDKGCRVVVEQQKSSRQCRGPKRTLSLSSSVRPGPSPMSQSSTFLTSSADQALPGARPAPGLRTACRPEVPGIAQ